MRDAEQSKDEKAAGVAAVLALRNRQQFWVERALWPIGGAILYAVLTRLNIINF